MDEIQFIKACRQGNKKAQKEIYELYQEKMFRLCYRYLGNIHDAEDIVVEGFLKIFERIKTFEYRNGNSFINWMKTIMINESLMFLRKNRRVCFFESDLIIEQENELDSSIELNEIFKVMEQMPDGYRTVFNLFVIEGYAHNEIAQKLEISVQTSKSQLSRAKKYLEKLLNDLNYERRAV